MKIIGFSIDKYDITDLDSMSDVQLYETMLEDSSNTFCYDNIEYFFDSLNAEVIDTENNWWKVVNID